MSEMFERMATEIKFAEIVRNESKRILIVLPKDLDRARWLIEQQGAERNITVEASPWIPADTWMLVDKQAIDAALSESLQRMTRQMFPLP